MKELNRPPIKEAVIDIRTDHLPIEKIDLVRGIAGDFKSLYPKAKEGKEIHAKILFDTGDVKIEEEGPFGIRLESEEGDWIVILRLDGFSISRLANKNKYKNWDELVEHWRHIWDAYIGAFSEVQIHRIGVRYVNEIEIPVNEIDGRKKVDLNEYFKNPPDIPNEIKYSMLAFYQKLRVLIEDIEFCQSDIVLMTNGINEHKNILPVIFDTDTYVISSVDACLSSTLELLEKLREKKNLMFEEWITDKTVDLCGGYKE